MLESAYTREEALKLPFAHDYYLMDGTICKFPIINFSRWFKVNKIGKIKENTEQWDILVYFFLNGCPWLPFEMRFDQGIEFTEENCDSLHSSFSQDTFSMGSSCLGMISITLKMKEAFK